MNTKDDNAINDIDNPKTTPYLLSHINEEREFHTSFKNGKLHHSWLICGNKGIGKATLCYRIARYIFSLSNPNILKTLNVNIDTSKSILESIENTQSYDDESYDDNDIDYSYQPEMTISTQQLNTHTKINLNEYDDSPLKLPATHPIFERLIMGGITDLIIIEREYADASKTKLKTEISVEQIRKLKEFFSKTSAEGGYRIAIIDSVDEMNQNSSNALLKILEEAPSQSLLLLVCHNINGLLPTIKSRCRILKLSTIDNENMELLLKNRFPNITNNELRDLINISEGSIGNAINIYTNEGLELQKQFFTLIPEIFNKKNIKIMDLCSLIKDENSFNIFREIIIKFLTNTIKTKSNITLNNLSSDEIKAITTLTTHYPNIKQLFKIREEILHLFELQPSLNLDITAVIISIFERIKNVY